MEIPNLAEKIKNLPKEIRDILKINGCTGFLEGTHTTCCDLHDFDYTVGLPRKQADKNFIKCLRCVRERQYYEHKEKAQAVPCALCRHTRVFLFWLKYKLWKVMAVVVYLAVRTFGWFFYYKAEHKREGRDGSEWLWAFYRMKSILHLNNTNNQD